jgi:hypothetical protein
MSAPCSIASANASSVFGSSTEARCAMFCIGHAALLRARARPTGAQPAA